MVKNLLIASVCICLVSSVAQANIRRVGFNGLAITGIDYASFADAHIASAAGDTIQIYGTVNLPGNGFSVTKRLTIMGFGYNFDVNPNLQAVGTDAPSIFNGLLIFDVGSENSVIEGVSFNVGPNPLDVATNNITIRRCRVSYYGIRLRNDLRPISNTNIQSCIASVQMFSPTSSNTCTNIKISNSILQFLAFYQNGSTGSIINCIMPNLQDNAGVQPQWNLNTAAFLVKNCIIFGYNANNVNTLWENNFFSTNQPAVLPAGNNNRWGLTWASLFDRLGGSSDQPGVWTNTSFAENFYLLKPGSAAINGGFDSANNPTDCGIFGGDAADRYKLGGVPAVPAIYKLTAPSSAANTNPYNITISVRSNN